MSCFKVGLGDVEEDVLQLRANLFVGEAVHVHARKNVQLDEFFVLLGYLSAELVLLGLILTLVLLVGTCSVEVVCHRPAGVDDSLEQTNCAQTNLFRFEKITAGSSDL